MTKDPATHEYDIYAQEGTTVKLLDGYHVSIEQEDHNGPDGVSYVSIRGPSNLDQLIVILQRIRGTML